MATISHAGKTLKVQMGGKKAWLDGKPVPAFHALRQGKDQMWAPVATLERLLR